MIQVINKYGQLKVISVLASTAAITDITTSLPLLSSGGATPNISLGLNSITNSFFRQSLGLSVVGRNINSPGNVGDIVAGSNYTILRRTGTTLGFGILVAEHLNNTYSTGQVLTTDASGNLSWDNASAPFNPGDYDLDQFTNTGPDPFLQVSDLPEQTPQSVLIFPATLSDLGVASFDLVTSDLVDTYVAAIDFNLPNLNALVKVKITADVPDARAMFFDLQPYRANTNLVVSGDFASSGDEGFANSITPATGLEALNESNGIGWRLIGRNPANYGNIGLNAVDLSNSSSASSVLGATGQESFTSGFNTRASGSRSFATGQNTVASGVTSFAAGNNNTTSGTSSSAFGTSNTISNTGAFGAGLTNTASGLYSQVFGAQNTSSGAYSTCFGINNLARSQSEFSIGNNGTDYSATNTPTDRLFNIGNSFGADPKSDAFTIFRNGAVRIFRATLASITNTAAGFFIGNSADSNRPYYHNGSAWKGLAYTDEIVATPVTSVNTQTGAVVLDAEDIEVSKIGAPTYTNLQHVMNLFGSPGRYSGGNITDTGLETIQVQGGTGAIKAIDSDVAELSFFNWALVSGISIPTNTTRYIGVEYNAGSPQVISKPTNAWDYDTEFPLGEVANESGILHILNNPHWVGDAITNIIERFQSQGNLVRDDRVGGLILGETGIRNVTVTPGTLWSRLTEFEIFNGGAFDTSGIDTFTSEYRDGSGGWITSTVLTQWPNDMIDDGTGTLLSMNNNWYGNLWFYVETDGDVVMLYPQNQYPNIVGAENEAPTNAIPQRLIETSILVGRIIFKKGASVAEEVESAFRVSFNTTPITQHNNLAGIQGGAVGEYYHLTAAELALIGTIGESLIRRNTTNGTTNYCGYAPEGSLTSDPVWTITKIEVALEGTTTTTVFFNEAWDDVLTL